MLSSEYRKIYKTLIADKAKIHIIEYSCLNKNLTYKPFSHKAEDNALDDLCSMIIDNTVFYAFSEDEILKYSSNFNILNDLQAAAKFAFGDRLPMRTNANSDGTLGEVLLDLLMQVYEPHSQKLIARAKYTEMNSNNEIRGYDALYFTKHNNTITLWLGQAKTGAEAYCKNGMKNDLNTKYTSDYFAKTAFYIAQRTDSPELLSIVNELNKTSFFTQKNKWSDDMKAQEVFNIFNKHNVTVKIPCLLAYSKDIYSDPSLLLYEVNRCAEQMEAYFDSLSYTIGISIPYAIVFYVFPIKDISYVRERIIDFKNEVV